MAEQAPLALAAELGIALKAHGLMLTLAESCTGGMVAQTITEVAGSSAWFDRGFVTYSNAAKTEMLGVSTETLEKFGAVSEQTAVEMASGALLHSHAHISASITGIAGPSGGSVEKPVGLVWFAWAIKTMPNCKLQTVSSKHYFDGNRQQIRQQASMTCMQGLLNLLKQH
jgi:nicotinamide-nucleotide amidase